MPQNHKNTHKNINAYKNKVNSALLIYLHYIWRKETIVFSIFAYFFVGAIIPSSWV